MADEYVLFVAPTEMQMRAYGRVVASGEHVLRGEQPLGYSKALFLLLATMQMSSCTVDLMRKIANTPTVRP